MVTSGVRMGTNSLAVRGMGTNEMTQCAALIHDVLASVNAIDDRQYTLDEKVKFSVRQEVQTLCDYFPIPRYHS